MVIISHKKEEEKESKNLKTNKLFCHAFIHYKTRL